MRIGIGIGMVATSLALAACSCGERGGDPAPELRAPTAWVAADDPAYLEARRRAHEGLDELIASLASEDPSHRAHALKVALREGRVVEHLWLDDVRWDGERFHGTVGNVPVTLRRVRYGDEVSVTREQVDDWAYEAPDGLHGAFSVPPELRQALSE